MSGTISLSVLSSVWYAAMPCVLKGSSELTAVCMLVHTYSLYCCLQRCTLRLIVNVHYSAPECSNDSLLLAGNISVCLNRCLVWHPGHCRAVAQCVEAFLAASSEVRCGKAASSEERACHQVCRIKCLAAAQCMCFPLHSFLHMMPSCLSVVLFAKLTSEHMWQ